MRPESSSTIFFPNRTKIINAIKNLFGDNGFCNNLMLIHVTSENRTMAVCYFDKIRFFDGPLFIFKWRLQASERTNCFI